MCSVKLATSLPAALPAARILIRRPDYIMMQSMQLGYTGTSPISMRLHLQGATP